MALFKNSGVLAKLNADWNIGKILLANEYESC